MKILSISSDKKIFNENSEVFKRQKEYTKYSEELHIVIFTKKGYQKKVMGNLHLYPTNSLSKYFYVFDAFKIAKKILKAIASNNLVITCQDPFETGLVGVLLKWKFNLKLQIQIHTDFLDSHFKINFLNRLRILISKFVIIRADRIRVVSSVIKKSVTDLNPKLNDRIDILPILVDLEKFETETSDRSLKTEFPQLKKIILMTGRLSPEKRIDVAIRALEDLLRINSDIGLVIVGEGTDEKKLINMAKNMGISDKVVFLPWQNDISWCYKSADLFLLTSEYEGYGMTLVEAGVSSCPIVTTRVGIAKTEVFRNGENSFVCDVGNVGCISQGIKNLIFDKEKQTVFSERMKNDIKNVCLTKQDYYKRYIELLEKTKNG